MRRPNAKGITRSGRAPCSSGSGHHGQTRTPLRWRPTKNAGTRRVFAAQELAQRLDSVLIPAVFVILSSLAMWFLLTVFALALQPKIRRALLREIADYSHNAEAEAYAAEEAHTPAGEGRLLAGRPRASDG